MNDERLIWEAYIKLTESKIVLRGNKKSPAAIEYKNIVYSWGEMNPLSEDEVIINNCLLKLQVSFRGVYIESIRTLPEFRNKGYASELMRKLTDLADKMNINLSLYPKQIEEHGVSKQSLINWYKKYNFEFVENDLNDEDIEMKRYPNKPR